MAASDYGFIASKNGKLIEYPEDGYMNMIDAVGYKREGMDGNYFAYLGDKDLFVAIYKCYAVMVQHDINVFESWGIETYSSKRVKYVTIDDVKFKIKRIGNSKSQYLLTFVYKGDYYRCVYGYGVGSCVNAWWKDLGVSKKERKDTMKYMKYIIR